MSKLNYVVGAKLDLIDIVQVHGDLGWESRSENNVGIYHSHDEKGVWVEVIQGGCIKLYQYPFNLVSIKLEKGE